MDRCQLGYRRRHDRPHAARGYAASSIARTLATVKRYARLAMAAGAIDAPAAAMIATVTAPKGRAAKQVDEARRSAGVATRRSTKRRTRQTDANPAQSPQRTARHAAGTPRR